MYRKELFLKLTLLQTLQNTHSTCAQETLSMYLSSWILEPYFDADRLAFVERVFAAEFGAEDAVVALLLQAAAS